MVAICNGSVLYDALAGCAVFHIIVPAAGSSKVIVSIWSAIGSRRARKSFWNFGSTDADSERFPTRTTKGTSTRIFAKPFDMVTSR